MRQLKTGQLIIISTVAFFATLSCLALLIANVSKVQLGEGGGSLGPTAQQIVPIAIDVLIGIWVVVFIIVVARFLVRGGSLRAPSAHPGSLVTWVVILVILTSLLAVTQLTNLQLNPGSQQQQTPPDQQNQNATAQQQAPWSSYAPTTVVVVILAAVIAIALALTVRSSRSGGSRRKAPPPKQATTAESSAVIEAAIEDMRTTDDARGAIIRIYAQMCRLMRRGPEEGRTLTPRELKVLAVREYGWPDEPMARLTLIFEEARYSDHRIKDSSKEIALDCLDQIKDSLPTQKGGAAAS